MVIKFISRLLGRLYNIKLIDLSVLIVTTFIRCMYFIMAIKAYVSSSVSIAAELQASVALDKYFGI